MLLAGCGPDALVRVDAGVEQPAPDAGTPDAGVVVDAGPDEEVDAGAPAQCDVEDLEFPAECEDDADWCNPRDQHHAYYDLATGWSHRQDEETWVFEVRTWGRMPLGISLNAERTSLVVAPNSNEVPVTTSWNSEGSETCTRSNEVFFFGDNDSFDVSLHFQNGLVCGSCPPSGPPGYDRECEADRGCPRWQVSTDLTTWRVEVPLIRESLHWSAMAASIGDRCTDTSGPFVPSRGGSADNVTWMPAEFALVCPVE